MKRSRQVRRRPGTARLGFETLEQRRLLTAATDVTLQVQTNTGDAQLIFNGSQQISGYEIDSASGQLIPGNWHSLNSQGNSAWSALASTSKVIAEGDLTGTLTASTKIDLGDLFTVGGTHDLTFKWSDALSNAYAPTVVYVSQAPDLTINNTHLGTFKQGDAADQYTITVNNAGTAATSGVVTVTDTLPTGLTATAAAGTGWTTNISGSTVTATRSDALAAGTSYSTLTVTVSVAAGAPASVTNSVQVSGGGETNTANDSASDLTAITQVADLTISESHAGSFQQGDAADPYTITVSNAGAGPTTGAVTVTDTVPAGLTPTAASGTGWTTQISGSTLTATRNDVLAAGASYPALTLTVSVSSNATSVTNTAQVSGGGELNASNDTASDPTTITIAAPDLTISMTHSGNFRQGDTADIYTLSVGNIGSLSTSGLVTVTDVLPTGLSPISATGTDWTTNISGSTVTATRSDALARNGTYPALTVTVSVANNAATSLTNTATVAGGGEINTANDSSSNPTTITQLADLTVSTSHSGNFKQGDTADNYTITVDNVGAGSTSGLVTVTDTLPVGLTPTAASGTGWTASISSSTVTATRSDVLANGASYPALTVTVGVALTASGSLTNTATVAGGGKLNTANDSASDATTIDPAGDLTIGVSHTGNFSQGDAADSYTVTVSNNGPGSSSGQVTVTDTLPAGLTPTAANGTGWTTNIASSTVTATRSDVLANGASYPALTVTVSVAGTTASSVTNTVQLSGGGDRNTANNSASDPTTVNATSGTLAGFVYFSSSNDGQRLAAQGTAKPGLSGVTVRLLSQNSQGTWTEVSGKSPIKTGSNGAYSFTGLAAATYRLQVTPPSNFLDGTDTAGNIGGTARGTASQDQIEVQLGGAENGTEYNFAMQGLSPSVLSIRMFLASTPPVSQFLQKLVTPSTAVSVSASPAAIQSGSSMAKATNQSSVQSPNPVSAAALLASSTAGQASSSDKKLSAAAVDAVMKQQPFLAMASGRR